MMAISHETNVLSCPAAAVVTDHKIKKAPVWLRHTNLNIEKIFNQIT